jgi:hypothetical protein
MYRRVTPTILACSGLLLLAAACSSGPAPYEGDAPQRSTLPDCEETNGYPPCAYTGDAPQAAGDYYPDYGGAYYPGTGVILVPQPVPVPVPVPTPVQKPPPKKPAPPPKHHRPVINTCHPQPGRPCP